MNTKDKKSEVGLTPKSLTSAIEVKANIVSQYGKVSGFPSDNIPVSAKDINFCKQFAVAGLGYYFGNRGEIGWANRGRMVELRKYLHGVQSVERYYPALFGEAAVNKPKKLEECLRRFRSDWKISSLMPPIVDYIKSVLDETDYYIDAFSLNPLAGDRKDFEKYKLLTQAALPPEYVANLQAAGVSVPIETMASNQAELDLLESIDYFKLPEELAASLLINHSFELSDWDHISDLMQEDAIAFNKAIAKDEFDPITGKAYARYVDPVNANIIRADFAGSKKIIHAGELRLMSIKDVKIEAAANGIELSGESLYNSAILYRDMYENRFEDNSTERQYRSNFFYDWDNLHVLVYDCEHLTYDTEVKKLRTNKDGQVHYHRVATGDEGTDEFAMNKIHREYYYRCKLIVGSEAVFSYGRCYNQKRYTPTKVLSNFHFAIRAGMSLVERSIPILNDMAVDELRYQNNRARATPPGVAIGKSALRTNKTAGAQGDDLGIMELYKLEGSIVFEDQVIVGSAIMNAGIPVKELPGGMGKVLEDYIAQYNLNLARLREVVNVRPIDPKPRTGLGITELTEIQNNRGLSGLVNIMKELKTSLSVGLYNTIKIAVKHHKEVFNGYYPLVGRSMLEAVKITADISSVDLGIKLVPRPTHQEVQMDLTRLEEQMRGGRDGEAIMDASLYFMIRNALLTGRKGFAEAMIILAEEKKKKWRQIVSDRNQKIQGEIAMRIEQAKAENEKMKIWEKARAEDWVLQNEHQRTKDLLLLQQIFPQKIAA